MNVWAKQKQTHRKQISKGDRERESGKLGV